MLFTCKACIAREAHISDLKAQIALLTQLTIPNNSQQLLPILNLEADAILTGHQHTIEATDAEMPTDEVEAVISERNRLLSGAY